MIHSSSSRPKFEDGAGHGHADSLEICLVGSGASIAPQPGDLALEIQVGASHLVRDSKQGPG